MLGGKLGVPADITKKVTDVTDSLFTKSAAGGVDRQYDRYKIKINA